MSPDEVVVAAGVLSDVAGGQGVGDVVQLLVLPA